MMRGVGVCKYTPFKVGLLFANPYTPHHLVNVGPTLVLVQIATVDLKLHKTRQQ